MYYESPFFDPRNCPHRLPCGYCEKLGRDCPKTFTTNINGFVSTNSIDYAEKLEKDTK